jgi:hypothetical protein
MDDDEKEALYNLKNIRIKIDSKGINLNSGEIFLSTNYLVMTLKNQIKIKKIKILYKDITFHAIEKQKKKIVLCDMKKYDIINILCNTEEEVSELFNQLCLCINEDNNINSDNIELEEEANNEKLLEEWEKKMIFNDNDEGKNK